MSFRRVARRVAPDRGPRLERNGNKVATPACKNLKGGAPDVRLAPQSFEPVTRDVRSPPGNRLEALGGDRKGQHSIRINDQFRVCFVWTAEGPAEVEIVDYH